MFRFCHNENDGDCVKNPVISINPYLQNLKNIAFCTQCLFWKLHSVLLHTNRVPVMMVALDIHLFFCCLLCYFKLTQIHGILSLIITLLKFDFAAHSNNSSSSLPNLHGVCGFLSLISALLPNRISDDFLPNRIRVPLFLASYGSYSPA